MTSLPPSSPESGFASELLAHVPAILYQGPVDSPGCFSFVSPAWDELTGQAPGVFLADGGNLETLVHPEDWPQVRECHRHFWQREQQFAIAYRLAHHSGSYQLVQDRGQYHWCAQRQRGFISGVIVPAAAPHGTVATHPEAQIYQLQQIVLNAPVAIAMFDRDMRYLAHSHQWLVAHQLPPQDLSDRTYYETFPSLPDHWASLHQECLQGKILCQPEECLTLPQGQKLYLRRTLQPWYEETGDLGGIIIVNQVINELVEARNQAIAAANNTAQFLANMSHEIRTPMNGVLAMTELLQDTATNPEQQEFIHTINNSAQHLLLLINDVLDFSKLEAHQMQLEQQDFNLHDCLEQIVDLLSAQAAQRGIELLLWVDPQLPEQLLGDGHRLRQILLNLLGNALKFTQEGEVCLRVRPHQEQGRQVQIHFEVQDTGIGITPEAQGYLFEPFSQAHAQTQEYGGTGLGLAISQQLAGLYGGEIRVKSQVGLGSRFWFEAKFQRGQGPSSHPSDRLSIEGLRVLVVEPHGGSGEIFRGYCDHWGVSCDLVADWQQALERLKTGESDRYGGLFFFAPSHHLNGSLVHHLAEFQDFFPLDRQFLMIQKGDFARCQRCLPSEDWNYLFKPVKQKHLRHCLLKISHPAHVVPSTLSPTPGGVLTQSRQSTAKILVVEDSYVNQKVIFRQLERLGYEQVQFADNGIYALQVLGQEAIDLVLMDCLMPRLDGYKTTQLLRKQEQKRGAPALPIIAMTGNALEGDREKCLAAGMTDYLVKPVTLEQLQETLIQYLGTEHFLPMAAPPDRPRDDTLSTFPLSRAGQELIDYGQLNKLVGDDRQWLQELLLSYVEHAQPQIQAIATAWAQEDFKELQHQAHQLKGASRMTGIHSVGELASILERKALTGDRQDVPQLIDHLKTIFHQVCEEIQSHPLEDNA